MVKYLVLWFYIYSVLWIWSTGPAWWKTSSLKKCIEQILTYPCQLISWSLRMYIFKWFYIYYLTPFRKKINAQGQSILVNVRAFPSFFVSLIAKEQLNAQEPTVIYFVMVQFSVYKSDHCRANPMAFSDFMLKKSWISLVRKTGLVNVQIIGMLRHSLGGQSFLFLCSTFLFLPWIHI